MVKINVKIYQAVALALVLTLAAPVAVLANSKKHFKQGLKYEENRQWDKAAEQFALAVAEKPSNVEYQLHLQRALVNAGIMLVERGNILAEKKDYNAAYQAYRQAYAFDRTNELALIKMRRMLEAQGLPTDDLPSGSDPAGPKSRPQNDTNVKAKYQLTSNVILPPGAEAKNVQLPVPGRKFSKTQVIARSDNLLSFIEQLAQSMGLNVIFDTQVANQLRNAKLVIELRDVTYPKALEMILKTNNLMYAQLDTRTIVIALDNLQSRSRYDQLAVRTFYIKNADIQEVRTAIQTTLPQAKGIVAIKQLNAIIVRDTPSNLELIDSMIGSLDKSKAEVLIDVNIYEVTNSDLLQIGQQFNTQDGITPAFLGGLGQNGITGGRAARSHTFFNNTHLGFGLALPTSVISFFQDKSKAKLLASTQIHVLDNEANTVRIGQRVPIQTASFFPSGFSVNTGNQGNNQNNNPANQLINTGFGGAFPQIQYENVGLNIDVTPSVYEDDVQMKMKIESSSVDNPNSLTPTFSQRTMASVARIKDGQTTLIAGVSQNNEAKGVRGFPILGLIPILGRFFSTPTTSNRQSDVVITVTPHILRRADITERDHFAYKAGTGADPSTTLTIEQILYLADVEESQQNQVAAAGGGGGGDPAKAMQAAAPAQTRPPTASPPAPGSTTAREGVVVLPPPVQNTTLQTQFKQPAGAPQVERKTVPEVGVRPDDDDDDDDDDEEDDEENAQPNSPGPVTVTVRSASAVATRGQDLYVAVIVNGNAEISYTNVSLTYDPNILEVKAVRDGGLLRAGGANPELQFNAENGVLTVQMERPQGSGGVGARGQLLLLVFNVKNQGQSPIAFNEQQTFFRTSANQPVPLKLQSTQVEAR